MIFPPDASKLGFLVDRLFYIALWLTGAAFAAILATLGYFLARYRASAHPRAEYDRGDDRRSRAFTIGFALLVFLAVDVNLAWQDQKAWAALYGRPWDLNRAVKVQVTGERYTWTFLYPGPHGEFGPPGGYEAYTLHVPVDRPVVLYITSKDVVHSLFIPSLRIKMDALPGMTTATRFIAKKPGTYPIACAEMCGAQHYQMGSKLVVQSQKGYEEWLKGLGGNF